MQQQDIKKWFIRIALVNLLLSLTGFLVSGSHLPMAERLSALMASNAGYFMMYGFIGFMPRYILRNMEQSPMYSRALPGVKLFACMAIFAGIMAAFSLILGSFSSGEYYKLFLVCSFMGVVLGGLSLYNYVLNLEKMNGRSNL